jgi:hypothetical protein
MADLDKLIVRIEADLKGLKKGLADANKTTRNSSKKLKDAFKDVGKSIANLGATTLKYGSIFATAFAGFQVKKVLDVGIQVENLTVKLNALFGSVEEGAKAFNVMLDFASRVPFELSEIQRASGNLAVVTENAEELAELLEITGNVAAITGLSFQVTAEQIQRSFSSGISASDLFREKGVRNMLGFSAGAEISLSQTKKAFRETFGRGGTFGNATEEFAKTLTGTLSMLQDKLLAFRLAISEEFFEEVKLTFNDLNKELEKNQDQIKAFGRELGDALATAVRVVVDNLDELLHALKILGLFLAGATGLAIIRFFTKLRNVLLIAGAGLIYLTIQLTSSSKAINDFAKSIDIINREIMDAIKTQEAWAIIQDIYVDKTKKAEKSQDEQKTSLEDLKEITEEVKETFDKAGKSIADAFGDAIAKGENFKDSMKNIFQSVISQIISTIVHIRLIKPIIESLNDMLDQNIEKQKQASAGSGGGFDVGSALSSAFLSGIDGRANGGFVTPNTPYMVGERGAEMFVPHTAGRIIPHGQGGSTVVVNQSLNFSTGVVPTVRAEVMNLMPQIKKETVSAVSEARSRGGTFARTFGA